MFLYLSKQTRTESFIPSSTPSKTDGQGLFHGKRSMNGYEDISHTVDCICILKSYLVFVMWMGGGVQPIVKPVSLIGKPSLSSSTQESSQN